MTPTVQFVQLQLGTNCYTHDFKICPVAYLTVEDRGRVMEKGVGGEEEQVGAV